MDRSVRSSAAKAQDSPALETGARLGYAASGVLHLLLAWVAIQLVVGHAATADQTGALESLATTGPGKGLLWVVLTGFVLLAVWHVTEVVARRGRGRVKPAAKAVVYLALAWTTFRVIQGTAANGNQQSVRTTDALMSHPGGRLLVAAIGVAIVAVAVHHVLKGWRSRFLSDLRAHPGTQVVVAGRVGYAAKGVALLVIGVLFVSAAATADPAKAQGLDGALRTLLTLPLGRVLVGAVALGLAAYGIYSFARARYARV